MLSAGAPAIADDASGSRRAAPLPPPVASHSGHTSDAAFVGIAFVNDHGAANPAPGIALSILDFMPAKLAAAAAAGDKLPDVTRYVQAAFNACASASVTSPFILTGPRAILPVHQITLFGSNCRARFDGTTFLNNSGTAEVPSTDILYVKGSNNDISGATFDGNDIAENSSIFDNAGVVDTGDNNRWHEDLFINNPNMGYLAFHATRPFLYACTAYANGLAQPKNNPGAGFTFSHVAFGRMLGNLSFGNAAEGIAVDNGSHHTVVDDNEVDGNGRIGCFGGIGSANGSDHNVFVGNISTGNTCWGIAHGGSHSSIVGNVTHDNAQGGIYDAFTPTSDAQGHYPASDFGANAITGNTTTEVVSIRIDRGVMRDVGLEGNSTNGVPIINASGTMMLDHDQAAPLAPEQARFGEITGRGDHGFRLPAPSDAGRSYRFWNNSPVPQTLHATAGRFDGPNGSGAASITIPRNATMTLMQDGYNYIVTTP